MKNIISLSILILCLFFSTHGIYAQDKVVAIVNNEVITQKDLNDFLNFVRLQQLGQFKGKELEEKMQGMKRDLLQRLIEDRLMLDQAKKEKIVIDQDKIKAKINEIKKRYTRESDFQRDLAKQGLVEADLEKKIRQQMLMYNIVEQKVRSKVVVWPDEINNFYNQNKGQFIKPEERFLTVAILENEDLAKAVSYQLRLGIKLEELAGKYSFNLDQLSAFQGQELRSEIENTVFKLGIGEISNPVKIDYQYYVFRLDNIIGSQQMDLASAQEEIQAYLFEIKLKKSLSKYLDELKEQAYIKIFDN